MSKQINQDFILRVIDDRAKIETDTCAVNALNTLRKIVEELPGLPEIVYCKDCQYYVYGLNEEDYYCRRTGIGQPDDFFCAYGKERDDGTR